MATTVGELNVRLNLELQRLDAQITAANAKIAKMGKSWHADVGKAARALNATLATIGAGASLSGLVAFGKSCLDLGGQIVDLASQAGIGTDAFQDFRAVAMESGATGEQVANTFSKLRAAIDSANSGNKEMLATFDRLNLSAKELGKLDLDVGMQLLARALSTVSDEQERYNLAAQVLGEKVGPKMMQFLDSVANGGLEKAADAIAKVRLTPEQLKTLDDAGDKLERAYNYIRLIGAGLIVTIADGAPELEKVNREMNLLLARKKQLEDGGFSFFPAMVGPDAENLDTVNARIRALEAIKASLTPASAKPVDLPALQAQQAAAAEAARIEQINADVIKATAEANKKAEAAAKDRAAADAKVFEEMRRQDAALNAVAESTLQMLDPSRQYMQQIEKINAALRENKLTTEQAAAAIGKLKESAVDASLDDFFKDIDAKQGAINKQFEEKANRTNEAARELGMTFSSAFEDATVDGKKLSDMLGGLADDLLRLALRKNITEPMFGALFSSEKSGGNGGGILGAIGGLFGGFFADGGRPSQGKVSFVGEEGIEAFVPDSAGTIVSNDRLRDAIGGGGGGFSVSIVQKFEAGVTPAQLADGLRQTYEAAKSGVMDAIQRRRGGFGALSAA